MKRADMKRTAILGASGYTGAEAVRLITGHPRLDLVALTGHSRAGERYRDIYPSTAHLDLPDVVTAAEVDWNDI
ncbi:MAG: N-acetyl-gamma-glutamyl-phosphate reductase, partial [Maricaulaceae bacterium]